MTRYQIAVMDNHTGKMLKAPMECEAFAIIAFHGEKKASGIHERMRCWMKGSCMKEITCAMHSEPNLRKAARSSVWRGWLWEIRHLFKPRQQRASAWAGQIAASDVVGVKYADEIKTLFGLRQRLCSIAAPEGGHVYPDACQRCMRCGYGKQLLNLIAEGKIKL